MTTFSTDTTETVDDVLDRIGALQPLIREHSAQNERDRKVSDEVIAALRDAGAFRLAAPRRFGGLEAGLRAMLDLSALIAEADGGTSWVTTLSNINAWSTCLYDPTTVDEIYADGPDAILSGVVSPGGTARKVPGGYVINGQ